MVFKVGDIVRVKPREWFDARPVFNGLSFTHAGSVIGAFRRDAAGHKAQITGRKEGAGGGTLYSSVDIAIGTLRKFWRTPAPKPPRVPLRRHEVRELWERWRAV